MLDRLVQMIVDRLEPKIERMIEAHLDELRVDLIDAIVTTVSGAANLFEDALPDIENRLKTEIQREITKKIVRGVK